MVGLGTLMILLAAWGFLKRGKLLDNPGYLRLMVYAIPVPYLALQAGWAVAEGGRQPWIVYGLRRTKDAVSPIATSQVAGSLAAFVVVYLLLAALDIYLLAKYARKSPA
jgi:cytochrome d ubiquinol oxidase subunit I